MNLDGEEDGSDLKSRTPLFLQDVEADSAKLVYVWVIDPRYEPNLAMEISMNIVMIIAKFCFTFWSSNWVDIIDLFTNIIDIMKYSVI